MKILIHSPSLLFSLLGQFNLKSFSSNNNSHVPLLLLTTVDVSEREGGIKYASEKSLLLSLKLFGGNLNKILKSYIIIFFSPIHGIRPRKSQLRMKGKIFSLYRFFFVCGSMKWNYFKHKRGFFIVNVIEIEIKKWWFFLLSSHKRADEKGLTRERREGRHHWE